MSLVLLFLPVGVATPTYVVESAAVVGTFTTETIPGATTYTLENPLGAGTFTVEAATTRLITYGDTPLLNGSVAYGQQIGSGGFMTPETSQNVGTYTPET